MNSKIVVIGAGASGIAAATKLLKLGFCNVTLLEAEDRFGGRINTVLFGLNVVDMGAQWCHGEKNNVVYELASKHDLFDTTGSRYHDTLVIRSNKEVVSKSISRRFIEIIANYLERCEEAFENSNKSMGELLMKNFFATLKQKEYSDIDNKIAYEFFEFYEKMQNSLDASESIFDVSAKKHYRECEGDPVLNWKDKGYVTFLRILMDATNENLGTLENRIIFNKKVKEINYEKEPILLKCDGNDNISADHVICTVSLGVLKENYNKMFCPKLPFNKINAIENIGFGTVNKIYLEFPTKFWPDDWEGCGLLWTEDDLREVRKRDDSWLEDIYGFYTVDYQPNILCGWVTGKSSRKMESCSDNEVIQSSVYVLRKFLEWDVPMPINFKRTLWFNNSNFRGSYSYRSMKTEEMQTGADDLAKPILQSNGKPILQFAGEATHGHYYSTVHGATESGWREANRLAEFYKTKKSHL